MSDEKTDGMFTCVFTVEHEGQGEMGYSTHDLSRTPGAHLTLVHHFIMTHHRI